jgi:hypothetical protein
MKFVVFGKGGIGKTTTAAGLSLALADSGQYPKVLIVDGDVNQGVRDKLTAMDPRFIEGGLIERTCVELRSEIIEYFGDPLIDPNSNVNVRFISPSTDRWGIINNGDEIDYVLSYFSNIYDQNRGIYVLPSGGLPNSASKVHACEHFAIGHTEAIANRFVGDNVAIVTDCLAGSGSFKAVTSSFTGISLIVIRADTNLEESIHVLEQLKDTRELFKNNDIPITLRVIISGTHDLRTHNLISNCLLAKGLCIDEEIVPYAITPQLTDFNRLLVESAPISLALKTIENCRDPIAKQALLKSLTENFPDYDIHSAYKVLVSQSARQDLINSFAGLSSYMVNVWQRTIGVSVATEAEHLYKVLEFYGNAYGKTIPIDRESFVDEAVRSQSVELRPIKIVDPSMGRHRGHSHSVTI